MTYSSYSPTPPPPVVDSRWPAPTLEEMQLARNLPSRPPQFIELVRGTERAVVPCIDAPGWLAAGWEVADTPETREDPCPKTMKQQDLTSSWGARKSAVDELWG